MPSTGATSASGSRRDLVERGAPVPQALQFEPRVLELRPRHRAARRQRLVAREPPLDDGDLLVEFALPLAHVGDVDRLQRRRHIGQHVALLDARAEPRKAARRRRQPAADGRSAQSRWRSDRG